MPAGRRHVRHQEPCGSPAPCRGAEPRSRTRPGPPRPGRARGDPPVGASACRRTRRCGSRRRRANPVPTAVRQCLHGRRIGPPRPEDSRRSMRTSGEMSDGWRMLSGEVTGRMAVPVRYGRRGGRGRSTQVPVGATRRSLYDRPDEHRLTLPDDADRGGDAQPRGRVPRLGPTDRSDAARRGGPGVRRRSRCNRRRTGRTANPLSHVLPARFDTPGRITRAGEPSCVPGAAGPGRLRSRPSSRPAPNRSCTPRRRLPRRARPALVG